MKDLKQVDMTYLETAPNSMKMTVNVEAPIEFVFSVFGEADAWVDCFKSITRVEWTTEPPHKSGATRTIDLELPGQPTLIIDEEFLEWEQNKRISFYFKRSSRKIFGGMLEDYKFSQSENGSTDIVWDLYYEGSGIWKMLLALMAGPVKKDNQTALNNFKALIEDRYRGKGA